MYQPKKTTIKLCDSLMQNIRSLYPYLIESGWFYHPANAPTIQAKINDLEKLFNSSGNEITGYINVNVFKQQLSIAKASFLNAPDNYSHDLLIGFVGKCDFCNLPLHEISQPEEEEVAQLFSSTFNIAEFYYASHCYDLAFKYYGKFIGEEVLMQGEEVSLAIAKQMLILISHEKNLPAAIDLIEKYAKDPKLNNLDGIDLTAWQKGLGLALNFMQHSKRVTTFMMAEKLVTDILAQKATDMNKASYFVLLGFLQDYLHYASAEIKPIIFYWLALADRALDYQYLGKGSSIYLKQCIYAGNTKMKQQCFVEYKKYLTSLYATNDQLSYTANNDLKELYRWLH